jgi:hypothetical protein
MKQLNWNHIKAASLIVLSLGFMSLGFQNCSKVGVADLGAAGDSSKLNNSDCAGCAVDPQGDGSGILPGDDHNGNSGIPASANNDGGDSDDNHDGIVNPGQPNSQPMDEESVAVAECLQHKGAYLSGPDIIDHNGNLQASADDLNLISDIKGNIKLQGKTAKAHVKKIEIIHGNVLICGMEVDSLENVKGNVRLVNSKVHNIDTVAGNLRLFGDSEVGSTKNIGGNTN